MPYGMSFAALSDPTRRAVFERLQGGPVSVGEIAAGLPVSRPAVSQHLKVLKEAGLVRIEAVGTRRLYEVDPQGLGELRTWLDRFWSDQLDAFKAEVERSAARAHPTASPPSRTRKKTP
jgi:DNA-binding transcriptional ArsR family regulator